jgi:cytoskeletal protein CcmA (bactofilin family)
MTMKKLFIGLFAGAFVILPTVVSAAQFKAGAELHLSEEAKDQNVYAVGRNVDTTASTDGDLIAAGETITVNGAVNGDVLLAGSEVTISAPVTGDVRIVAGQVLVSEAVGGELAAVGQSLTVASGTSIMKDVYLVGATVVFSGVTAGGLVVRGGEDVYIDGAVAGDVNVKAGASFEVGPHAVIQGALTYSASREAQIDPDAKIAGGAHFTQVADRHEDRKERRWFAAIFTAWTLIKIAGWWILAYILLSVWRKPVMRMQDDLRGNFWWRVLYGLCILILLPIAAIIVMFTVVGIIPALMALLVYGALLLCAGVFLALTSASLLNEFVFKKRYASLPGWLVLLGIVAVCLVTLVPFVGGLVVFIAFLAGFGTLVRGVVAWIRPARSGE